MGKIGQRDGRGAQDDSDDGHRDWIDGGENEIVICSVGEKPETDATDDYDRIADKVLSTRYNGTIQVRIWADGEVWVEDHDGDRLATLPPLKA